jgi:glycerophosphoryl diester phosphodiesterase
MPTRVSSSACPSDRRAARALALALAGTLALAGSCGGRRKSATPAFPDGGLLRGADPVRQEALARLAGLYAFQRDTPRLRGAVVAHVAPGTLSLFAAADSASSILRAGCIDGGARLVLEGVWRFPREGSLGLMRVFVGPETTARALCAGDDASLASVDPAATTLDVTTGDDDELPTDPASATFQRPLEDPDERFLVGGHRGACRTIDDCGVSENSVESIRQAESFGAAFVEVDVRTTADGVPILYHDETFTPRLSDGPYCHGPVAELPFAHVRALCTLHYGERVPTLDEALAAALDDTTLRGAWLDVKTLDALEPAIAASRRFGAAAEAKGRRFDVVVGLGERGLVDAFIALGPPDVPCLVELDPADVRAAGCRYWGPRWTRGPMAPDVAALQAEGRGVLYWALDESEYIDAFLTQGKPNALLSDRPGLVRQRFEVVGVVPPKEVRP